MSQVHIVPEIYNPNLAHSAKCEIVLQLCKALARYRGVSLESLRKDLKEKVNVDFLNLENNSVGMFLLYEYLYNLRPDACTQSKDEKPH